MGMLFFPNADALEAKSKEIFEKVAAAENFKVRGRGCGQHPAWADKGSFALHSTLRVLAQLWCPIGAIFIKNG